ncbi:unnamed protein product, partial [Mesorhabditis belari]|uniref:HECT-type E3 ubiquitin transferase n=1 Tax=Mesorhabditis belari TaxID=2138241 RepID=A0AAF3E8B8_9BILA
MLIVSQGKQSGGGFSAESNRLGVSRLELYLGPDTHQTIKVSWVFESEVSALDWIGLYDRDDADPLAYRDYKSHGVVGVQRGEIKWPVAGALFAGSPTTHICFRYFDGITGALRAVSPSIFISSVPRLQLRAISASGVGRSAVQARVECGETKAVTATSNSANWENLDLQLSTSLSSLITIAIIGKNQSRLLEGSIPVTDIVKSNSQDIVLPLRINESPKKSKATLTVTFNILPEMNPKNPKNLQKNERKMNDGLGSDLGFGKGVVASHSGGSMSTDSGKGSADPSTSSNTSLPTPPELPPGWEARVDRYGRVFYIDHTTKQTTWRKPETNFLHSSEDLEAKGKKYHFVRRTIANPLPDSEISVALKFLRRSDFVNILHSKEEALRMYNESQLLKHMVHRLRRSEDRVEKFEHNREFVTFLNLFADSTQPLPPNWQASGTNPTIFIDHVSRKTTLLDPRLPIATEMKRRTRSAPPQRRNIDRDSNGNLLEIMTRTEEIAAAVEKRMPQLASKVKRKLRLIERMGASALDRLANDVDLILAISMLDSDENANTTEFEEKISHFYNSLQRNGYGSGPQKIKLRFSRTNLLHDAFDQILNTDPNLLRRARLSIQFDDEDGLDYGGPSRELFFLLSREIFNPYYGLFEYSAEREYTVQINPMSTFVDQHLKWMELAGRVLGLALVHRCLIDTFFTNTFYKQLLEQSIELNDLESLDADFHQNLCWLKENSVNDDLELSFLAMHDVGGEIIEKELLPNGRDLKVSDSNKEEFINLMTKWRVERGCEAQIRALLFGLHQIVDREFLRVFTAGELKTVLSGIIDIDLDDWRQNTEYRSGYYDGHIVVQWFWDAVEAMSNADRLKLLQFVTGTSSIPFEGFRGLRGSSGPKKFTIERWGEEGSLPRAHTCFNRLDLPCYRTRHSLASKLSIAIHEGINYAIE